MPAKPKRPAQLALPFTAALLPVVPLAYRVVHPGEAQCLDGRECVGSFRSHQVGDDQIGVDAVVAEGEVRHVAAKTPTSVPAPPSSRSFPVPPLRVSVPPTPFRIVVTAIAVQRVVAADDDWRAAVGDIVAGPAVESVLTKGIPVKASPTTPVGRENTSSVKPSLSV